MFLNQPQFVQNKLKIIFKNVLYIITYTKRPKDVDKICVKYKMSSSTIWYNLKTFSL